MAEAFERVLLDAAYCDLTVEDEEDLEEDNDEKMDVDWDTDCENIETGSSPSNTPFIELGSKPIPIEQIWQMWNLALLYIRDSGETGVKKVKVVWAEK
ncbi:hypothetical protein Y032_0278g1172 [Ancylostoma ceylanicum]|uniref:Uncharacterized protein n=1 Tax=Ancylostoma ceylanicum TaxID=53326 RepID=A0A016S7S5_9BILA|nr:hypothetical protein Y032_0278g1172 [Ancylostoma ceylanicum]